MEFLKGSRLGDPNRSCTSNPVGCCVCGLCGLLRRGFVGVVRARCGVSGLAFLFSPVVLGRWFGFLRLLCSRPLFLGGLLLFSVGLSLLCPVARVCSASGPVLRSAVLGAVVWGVGRGLFAAGGRVLSSPVGAASSRVCFFSLWSGLGRVL